jgi:hypothetical protein
MADFNVANSKAELENKHLVTRDANETLTGQKSFDRGAGVAPFVVVRDDAAMVTNLDAHKVGGQTVTQLRDASQLTGTIPDASIPNPLPGVSGEALTNLQASQIVGAALRWLLTGRTSAQLASMLSGPGEAALAYDSDLERVVASLNGGAYLPLGDAAALVDKTADYTATAADDVVRYTAASTNHTLTLPAASASGLSFKALQVINDGTGTITVQRAGTDLIIDGLGVAQTSLAVAAKQSLTLRHVSASRWRVVSGTGPLACSVFNNTTQSIATSTFTVVTFNSEDFDDAGMHSTSSNSGRITVPEAGVYFLRARVSWQVSGTGVRGLILRKNGSAQLTIANAPGHTLGSFSYHAQQVSGLFQLAAADYLEVVAFQDSGGNLTIGDVGRRDQSEFQAFRIR